MEIMNGLIAWTILCVGVVGAASVLRGGWPGWIGLPVALLIARLVQETAVSLLVAPVFGTRSYFFAGEASSGEIPAAVGLIVLSYLSIFVGLMIPRMVRGRGGGGGSRDIQGFPPEVRARGWRASVTVFAFGLVVNGVVLYLLLSNVSWEVSRPVERCSQ